MISTELAVSTGSPTRTPATERRHSRRARTSSHILHAAFHGRRPNTGRDVSGRGDGRAGHSFPRRQPQYGNTPHPPGHATALKRGITADNKQSEGAHRLHSSPICAEPHAKSTREGRAHVRSVHRRIAGMRRGRTTGARRSPTCRSSQKREPCRARAPHTIPGDAITRDDKRSLPAAVEAKSIQGAGAKVRTTRTTAAGKRRLRNILRQPGRRRTRAVRPRDYIARRGQAIMGGFLPWRSNLS